MCIYVHISVFMYVLMCVYMYTLVYLCMYSCVYICTHLYIDSIVLLLIVCVIGLYFRCIVSREFALQLFGIRSLELEFDYGLSPFRCQNITWPNDVLVSTGRQDAKRSVGFESK